MARVAVLSAVTAVVVLVAALVAVNRPTAAVGVSGARTSDLPRALLEVEHEEHCSPLGGGPVAVLTPDHGPVGTRVSMSVGCVAGRFARSEVTAPAYGVFLMRDFSGPLGCELIAGGRYRLHLVGRTRAAGWFTVGRRGGCFQSDGATRAVTPGRYVVGMGCHACVVASFRVTR
jgi:hypothetical protein